MIYIWLTIVCVSLLIEAINAGTLVTIWFAAGAAIPLVMSLFNIEAAWYVCLQLVIFGVVSSLCLIFLRKISKKVLFRNSKDKTNLDLYIGRKYTIINKINNFTYIKLNGVEYSAVMEGDDEVNDLMLGDKVKVLRFAGNKAIVEKVEK